MIEDNPEHLETIAMYLRSLQATFREAQTAQEALDTYEALGPNVIVSDLMLPGVDGYSLMRRLRERGVRVRHRADRPRQPGSTHRREARGLRHAPRQTRDALSALRRHQPPAPTHLREMAFNSSGLTPQLRMASISRPGMCAKSFALRVRSTAFAAAAVTPIAMSAARLLGEPRLRNTSPA